MADIKHYLQIKKDIENKSAKTLNVGKSSNVVKGAFSINTNSSIENSDGETDEDYHTKIRRHRIKIAISIGVAVIAFIVLAIIVTISLENVTYKSYTITKSINKEDTEFADYIHFGEGYIRYSNDGISYYSKNGDAIWNQTYQMKNPQVKICDKSVAVGDLNGTSIYMFSDTGIVGNVDTSLSIQQIEVSSLGLVAAVLEDEKANYINLYDTNGEKLYTVKTTLDPQGYPLDIGISDDATKLIASFVYVNGGSINTNVVFYNFSEVGQNEATRIAGGFNQYGSTLVPDVEFLSNTCAVALGENIVSIYNIKETPNLVKEINFDSQIDRVFTSESYIGVVLKNNDSGSIYKMVIYNLDGSKELETSFNTEYNKIKFDGKSILMYNDTTFTLMNMNGKVQFEQTFDLPIKSVLSLGSRGNYILISSKYIQEIKLK